MLGSDSSQAPEIAFYRSDDLIMGFLGLAGIAGVWLMSPDGDRDWKFCPPGSKSWDRFHQKVYRQHKAEPCDAAGFADRLPPVPHGDPPPEKYHLHEPPEPIARQAKPGSKLFQYVTAAGGRLPVYVVLCEDLYESGLGDGEFHYFDSAFFDDSTARARTAEKIEQDAPNSRNIVAYHVRPMHLEVREGSLALDTDDAGLSPFDHFTLSQVTDELATRLGIKV